jgi:hypothetical protein
MSTAKSHRPLPVAEWPELDRRAWMKANEVGDEYSEPGAGAQWADRSRENAELAYGRLIGFVQRNGGLRPLLASATASCWRT